MDINLKEASANNHCRHCKGLLKEDEESGSVCGTCIWNFIQDSKKDSDHLDPQRWMGR